MLFDLIVILVLVIAFFYGLIRGFLRQFISLAGLLTAAYLAVFHYGKAVSYLSPYIKERGVLVLASIALTFLVTYIAFAVGSMIISFFIKGPIGFLDRVFGAIFAVFKAFLFLTVISLFLASFNSTRNFIAFSKTGPYIYSSGLYMAGQVEKIWRERWKSEKNLRK